MLIPTRINGTVPYSKSCIIPKRNFGGVLMSFPEKVRDFCQYSHC